jgi:hypothetical protein
MLAEVACSGSRLEEEEEEEEGGCRRMCERSDVIKGLEASARRAQLSCPLTTACAKPLPRRDEQVMWTPEEPWEVLEKADLYLEYPELMPL